ncbi:hypothetical protein [Piscirickettsia salmonis]|uniref:hypothetical protein n=1 Tax=Piscirickettsia salmonis TaxID=1238 RepID=UPI0018C1E425|nr:hypothetical protein [Piscirickettsia salmonis]
MTTESTVSGDVKTPRLNSVSDSPISLISSRGISISLSLTFLIYFKDVGEIAIAFKSLT